MLEITYTKRDESGETVKAGVTGFTHISQLQDWLRVNKPYIISIEFNGAINPAKPA